jgi:hypothetical protein
VLAEIVEAREDLLGSALDGVEPVATTAQNHGRDQSRLRWQSGDTAP